MYFARYGGIYLIIGAQSLFAGYERMFGFFFIPQKRLTRGNGSLSLVFVFLFRLGQFYLRDLEKASLANSEVGNARPEIGRMV